MTVGTVQANCVNCGEQFRFKPGKTGKTIRNLLQLGGARTFKSRLPNKRIACICKLCVTTAGTEKQLAVISKPYKELELMPKKEKTK